MLTQSPAGPSVLTMASHGRPCMASHATQELFEDLHEKLHGGTRAPFHRASYFVRENAFHNIQASAEVRGQQGSATHLSACAGSLAAGGLHDGFNVGGWGALYQPAVAATATGYNSFSFSSREQGAPLLRDRQSSA